MDFEFSSKVKDLQAQLSDFMDEHIYPKQLFMLRSRRTEVLETRGYQQSLLSH